MIMHSITKEVATKYFKYLKEFTQKVVDSLGLERLYEDTKNYDQAKIYYEKACKLNDSFGGLSLDLYMGLVNMPSRKI